MALLDLTVVKEMIERDKITSRELVAGVAHEIRNPLAGIMTTAETLIEQFEPNDAKREYLERIITEINRMNKFLIRFFAFARPQKPQKTMASIPKIIDHLFALEAQNITRNNITVIKEYQPALPDVMLDEAQTSQVLLNLIINSIQAMPKGGQLIVRVISNSAKSPEPAAIQIDVIDSGVGINPNDLKNVFKPFYTTKAKGVGLGLSVSRQIINEHQGSIDVSSIPGHGTTFTVSLPLDE